MKGFDVIKIPRRGWPALPVLAALVAPPTATALTYGSSLLSGGGSVYAFTYSQVDTLVESWLYDLVGVRAELMGWYNYYSSDWVVQGVPANTYPVTAMVLGSSACPAGGTWELFGTHEFVNELGSVQRNNSYRTIYIEPGTPCDY
jgi:hypothetical protein